MRPKGTVRIVGAAEGSRPWHDNLTPARERLEKALEDIERGVDRQVALDHHFISEDCDTYQRLIEAFPDVEREIIRRRSSGKRNSLVKLDEDIDKVRPEVRWKARIAYINLVYPEMAAPTRLELSGPGGAAIRTKQEVDLSQLSTEELERLLPILDKLKPDQG